MRSFLIEKIPLLNTVLQLKKWYTILKLNLAKTGNADFLKEVIQDGRYNEKMLDLYIFKLSAVSFKNFKKYQLPGSFTHFKAR